MGFKELDRTRSSTPLPSEGAPGLRLARVLRAASRPLNRAISTVVSGRLGATSTLHADRSRMHDLWVRGPLIPHRITYKGSEAGPTSGHDARGERSSSTSFPRRASAVSRAPHYRADRLTVAKPKADSRDEPDAATHPKMNHPGDP
jgi:hypothetical protein